jgi:exodeoxyribonuclease V alpha subunit
VEEPEQGVQAIRDIMTHLIPQQGFDPAKEVQVLCPMSRGDVGTRMLNQVLQQLVNPPAASKAEIVRGGITLRGGDPCGICEAARILQQKNDYNREVFNGDLGVITAIDVEEQEVSAQFGDREVTYNYADLNEITLAFATTIHKAQGSEYPVVILPVFMQHYMMLSRNLIYTGLTRARKLAIVVGSQKAIGLSVKQVKDQERYTLLSYRLSKG